MPAISLRVPQIWKEVKSSYVSDFLYCKGHTREDDAHLQIVSQILPSFNMVHKRRHFCFMYLQRAVGNLFLNIFSVEIKICICLHLNSVLE